MHRVSAAGKRQGTDEIKKPRGSIDDISGAIWLLLLVVGLIYSATYTPVRFSVS